MRGPYWTPITPLTGSLLHAGPQIEAAPAIFRRVAKDRIEVLLSKEALKRIPSWKALLKDQGVRGIMNTDSDKPTVRFWCRVNRSRRAASGWKADSASKPVDRRAKRTPLVG